MTGFDTLTTSHGGDPPVLLAMAGLDPADVGRRDRYIPLRSAIAAVEGTATVPGVDDFGRRLAVRPTCLGVAGPSAHNPFMHRTAPDWVCAALLNVSADGLRLFGR
ncbi:AraC family transcriptional regulator ligand-binding domain-containing protein [Mycobacterium sp. 852013-50091_SCH5140682]|uniref:AraC family transcriptional regulator ligand-binding domain-containing protein n=1 Tax=Mycobacterium sp. 852013-50091_SCH5140682 TaxID=1834109 RepID=UPI0012EAEBFF|nr:AraC family transcriptional regulator ligand-binding domain-containing protein [Mycobacterium sp. 852013-50091_SCH5140682]